MKKRELIKIWKQLDAATEALEKLEETGMETENIFSDVVTIKNAVEKLIDEKTISKKFEGR